MRIVRISRDTLSQASAVRLDSLQLLRGPLQLEFASRARLAWFQLELVAASLDWQRPGT